MRRIALTILCLLPLTLGACDRGQALQAASCALQDDQLSVAFTDPGRARDELKAMAAGLEAGDPQAIRDAAELVASLAACI